MNPLFWKLHGWVDDRIGAWKAANGLTGEYEWKGTWSGPMHHHLEAVVHREPTPALTGEAEELLKLAADAEPLASPFLRVELS